MLLNAVPTVLVTEQHTAMINNIIMIHDGAFILQTVLWLDSNCALLEYYAASGGNSHRRFGTNYRSHFKGKRIQKSVTKI